MKELLNNIELTKQIILYTTLLSNNSSSEWDNDSKKIIDFIFIICYTSKYDRRSA